MFSIRLAMAVPFSQSPEELSDFEADAVHVPQLFVSRWLEVFQVLSLVLVPFTFPLTPRMLAHFFTPSLQLPIESFAFKSLFQLFFHFFQQALHHCFQVSCRRGPQSSAYIEGRLLTSVSNRLCVAIASRVRGLWSLQASRYLSRSRSSA